MDLEPSGWIYDTGATGGVGIAFVAASGGAVYLTPPGGQSTRFLFGGLGAGYSVGLKIPKVKLPKLTVRGKSVAGAASTKDFYSGGLVFRRRTLGRELTADDIRGAIVFVELGGGLIAGASGDAMVFGMNPVMVALGLSNPGFNLLLSREIANAPGALLFGGVNVGAQAGGGIAGLVGYMH